jgi:hypothetical protein
MPTLRLSIKATDVPPGKYLKYMSLFSMAKSLAELPVPIRYEKMCLLLQKTLKKRFNYLN